MTLDAIENNEISLNISEKDTYLLKIILIYNHEISQSNETVIDFQNLSLFNRPSTLYKFFIKTLQR